jgi:hypothetical protein
LTMIPDQPAGTIQGDPAEIAEQRAIAAGYTAEDVALARDMHGWWSVFVNSLWKFGTDSEAPDWRTFVYLAGRARKVR